MLKVAFLCLFVGDVGQLDEEAAPSISPSLLFWHWVWWQCVGSWTW